LLIIIIIIINKNPPPPISEYKKALAVPRCMWKCEEQELEALDRLALNLSHLRFSQQWSEHFFLLGCHLEVH
jgi:hypothetical protein